MPTGAGNPEAMSSEEADQRAPEDAIQHHCGSDALGPEGEPGICAGHPRLRQQPVTEGRAGGRASG
jgi:hypothetical protein